jgi:hypothetical protein
MEPTVSRLPCDAVREFQHDGVRWRALEGWRSRAGHTLCYFVVLQEEKPSAADSLDRRASLAPGQSLVGQSEEQVVELLGSAAPLTATERRVTDPEGAIWLIQNSGPVWAEGGLAGGLTGIVLTRLGSELRRIERPGHHLADLSEEELTGLLAGTPLDPDGPDVPAKD